MYLCLPLPSFPSSTVSYSASCLLPPASCLAHRTSRLLAPLLDNLSTVRARDRYSPFLFLRLRPHLHPRRAPRNRPPSLDGRTSFVRSDTASRRSPSVSDKRDLGEGALGHAAQLPRGSVFVFLAEPCLFNPGQLSIRPDSHFRGHHRGDGFFAYPACLSAPTLRNRHAAAEEYTRDAGNGMSNRSLGSMALPPRIGQRCLWCRGWLLIIID